MWVLLIVFSASYAMASEQLEFPDEQSCREAAYNVATDEGWQVDPDHKWTPYTVARCVWVPKEG